MRDSQIQRMGASSPFCDANAFRNPIRLANVGRILKYVLDNSAIANRWLARSVVVVCCLPAAIALQAQEPANTKLFLDTFCARCHNADQTEGDVRLDRVSDDDVELFGRIYEQLSSGQMPPDDEQQPTSAERTRIASHFLGLAKLSSSPPTAGLRRLNKREYSNTVRDLLGLRDGIFDPGKLIYKDEVTEGFDTDSHSLVTSNELLLEYLQAAQSSLQQALFSFESEKPEPTTIKVNTAKMKGGSRRYETKSRNAYVFRVGKSKIRDGSSASLIKIPGRYRITVTASAIDKDRYSVPFAPVNSAPVLGVGTVSGDRSSVSEFDSFEKTFPLKYDQEQTFQVERRIDQGFYPYLRFVNGSAKPITQIRSNLRRKKITKKEAQGPFVGPGIRITKFEIEGPFFDQWPPESVRTTIGSNTIPDLEDETARLFLLGRFAKRAFRRRVSREEMAIWEKYLNDRHAVNKNWPEAIIETMTAMMASPDFLYLREDEGELDAYQMANRLSYFFWSTMPDAQLFSLAESGKLKDPQFLKRQVAQMLDDPRSERFSRSFVDQWLALDTLGTMPPDSKLFRFYNSSLESAMLSETRLFFRHVLEDNRSVREFIDSDYTFLNGSLANLYDISGKSGGGKVKRRKKRGLKKSGKTESEKLTLTKLPENSGRGGILGHASVLTLTSNGVETSPVERGVWVLEHFMGTPPPPPPEEVPALVPDLNGAQTVRQMLEKHRSDTACMKCHRRMDPLGFALEAYDPVGRFRTKYSKRQKVSTQGRFKGQTFDDIAGLKKILASDIRPFARNLIVRIAEYAKGRKLVPADYPTVEAILNAAEKEDFKLKYIVYQIAISDLMTYK